MAHCNLAEFVAFLRQAEIVSPPDGEEWKSLIDRISVPGRIAAINEETFWYFLEVLPPKYRAAACSPSPRERRHSAFFGGMARSISAGNSPGTRQQTFVFSPASHFPW